MSADKREDRRRWIFGRKPVQEVLRHRPADAKRLLAASGAKFSEEFNAIVARSGVRLEKVSRSELDELFEGGHHQGVALEAAPRSEFSVSDLAAKSLSADGSKVLAVLDQVTDPHNLGAVLRAADGAGVDGVIATRDKSAPLSAAAARASSGASEFVPLVQTGNLQRTLGELKSHGYWIVGLQLDERAQNLYEARIPYPCAVVLGAEGAGLRRLTQRECDLTITIPMQGHLESLNVSQAAAVFFYELLRRRSSEQ